MLKALVARNPRGVTVEREPAERLVLSCRYYAMLLISILKHQGVPARVRVGFASYVHPASSRHFDHWIAEVWNEREGRWMFVDPDFKRIDFEGFELAGEVWVRARRGEIDPEKYGFHVWWGLAYVLSNVCHDLFSCLNHEPTYGEGPELYHRDVDRFSAEEALFVDRLARLLRDPDENLAELMSLRAQHPLLQNVRGMAPDL